VYLSIRGNTTRGGRGMKRMKCATALARSARPQHAILWVASQLCEFARVFVAKRKIRLDTRTLARTPMLAPESIPLCVCFAA
jgi:hypothetical protein